MKMLLICAGGMSTSMLVKKLEKYAATHGIEDFKCEAHGAMDLPEIYKNWDVVLYGPQVSNRAEFFRETVGADFPLGKIEPTDYAIGNADKIFALANKLLSK
ncbi:MAG: PTS sugar transporter subunit IIB [Erysipelotrichia bacterium]|nr:PTS sugar transporter subunit IIB [Erysipelotrichia bacterium]